MKLYSFLPASLLGMLLFLMVSCGDQNDRNDDATSDSAVSDTMGPTPPAPTSSIVTTPEHMLIVKHKVGDFDKFLSSYEQHDSLRRANGIRSYVIGRGVEDPNMVLVATKVDDTAKAKAFGKSSHLKQAMQKAGVTGKPDIRFVVITFQDTGMISQDLRSRTTFTVKDWDHWQRSFDSSRQVRIDNGIVDRVYGHDADNNKRVNLVVAVTDTAKAAAFWKSDQLKQLRAASGAIGEPERFLFRVVKRYK
jgi:hypothetical protein